VREALFSILGQNLDGQRVLDMFAGTGSIGIEASSRGATDVVFLESNAGVVQVLAANAGLLDGIAQVEILCRDALSALPSLARREQPFDLVFLDPPYGKGLAGQCLSVLAPLADQLLQRSGVIVVETDGHEELPQQVGAWNSSDNRSYGQTRLGFYRHGEAMT
jgi:16S rRNA (guanine(966)-N(2))-methyltransferase RsmD